MLLDHLSTSAVGALDDLGAVISLVYLESFHFPLVLLFLKCAKVQVKKGAAVLAHIEVRLELFYSLRYGGDPWQISEFIKVFKQKFDPQIRVLIRQHERTGLFHALAHHIA